MIFAISAPLRDRSGAVIAALTAIGFREDFAGAQLKANERCVVATAARCSALLQGASPEAANGSG
jgi:DNA-binding IclR family transcriptional regulator